MGLSQSACPEPSMTPEFKQKQGSMGESIFKIQEYMTESKIDEKVEGSRALGNQVTGFEMTLSR